MPERQMHPLFSLKDEGILGPPASHRTDRMESPLDSCASCTITSETDPIAHALSLTAQEDTSRAMLLRKH